MFTHPELLRALAKEHQADLIADADAHRVLAAARRRRQHTRRATSGRHAAGARHP